MSGIDHIEAIGSLLGAIGALLLATNSRWSGYGFVAFLASNVAWLIFGQHTGHWLFFAQQVVFTFTSLLGFWRWLIRPHLLARRTEKLARIRKLGPPRWVPLPLSEVEIMRTPVARSDDMPDALPMATTSGSKALQ